LGTRLLVRIIGHGNMVAMRFGRLCLLVGRILLLCLKAEDSSSHQKANCPSARVHFG
jgi:hypothetical protein